MNTTIENMSINYIDKGVGDVVFLLHGWGANIDLFNDDCLSVLEQLSCDGVKVDLVLCDPPYGTTNNEWDIALPFDRLFELLDGVSHSSTTCCLFGSEPFSSRLRFSNFDDYKYDLYWLKNRTTGFVHAKNMPLKNVELVSVFSKGNIGHKGRSIR